MTDQIRSSYINLQENETENNGSSFQEENLSSEQNTAPESSNQDGEMSDIEIEMFSVAQSAFNRKREQAHAEIDKLYDEMIRSAKDKVKGITASIVAEVSGQ